MIHLTRLNGSTVTVNAELIELVESTPDTVITLTTGKKLLVGEPTEEIVRKVLCYRRALMAARPGKRCR